MKSLVRKVSKPLIGKMNVKMNSVMKDCRGDFRCFYEEKDSIGKRYRRMDALGTPFCVTVDHQTKEDQTVTIRYRDSMTQERIPISSIRELVRQKTR